MKKLIILTGAGISAESGISTFRDQNGLWENHHIDQVCNALTWKKNFQKVHNFYNERRKAVAIAQPNAAHNYISKWSELYNTVCITQNVDDLLERSGTTNVIHLHNEIGDMYCTACGYRWNIGFTDWDTGTMKCPNPNRNCESRKGVRPGIVMFNDPAPKYALMYRALKELTKDDIVIVSGTSNNVIDFNSILFDKPGIKLWNNLILSGRSHYDLEFIGPAGEQFELIDDWLSEYF